jgi:hypothetical protein
MKHQITLRIGASDFSLTAGDVRINLSACTKEERYQTRRTLIETLKRQGYFRNTTRKAT